MHHTANYYYATASLTGFIITMLICIAAHTACIPMTHHTQIGVITEALLAIIAALLNSYCIYTIYNHPKKEDD